MKKEITLKVRTLILIILLVLGLISGGLFLWQKEVNKYYENVCKTDIDVVLKECFLHDFHGDLMRLSNKMKGEGYVNDFYNALEVKVFIEYVGEGNPYHTVDERVCTTIGDKNLTQMVRYGYAESLKRTKNDKKIKIFEESFFDGLKIIQEKCQTIPSKDNK